MRNVVLLLILATGCQPSSQAPSTTGEADPERQAKAVRTVSDACGAEIRNLRAKLADTTDRHVMMTAVAAFAEKMEAVDLAACPNEFAEAVRAWIKSWRRYAEALNQSKSATVTASAEIDERWEALQKLAKAYKEKKK
jgi:hypothetical protein